MKTPINIEEGGLVLKFRYLKGWILYISDHDKFKPLYELITWSIINAITMDNQSISFIAAKH